MSEYKYMADWRSLHGDRFAGLRVLVTGGAGFIGSHLAEALVTLGATVVVLDDLSGGDRSNLDFYFDNPSAFRGELSFVEGSILDESIVEYCVKGCRYVFHQAALGSVPRSVEQPVLYTKVNVIGTLNVLEAARQANVQRVTYAASSSAYGDSEVLPKVETMPPLPKSPYAASKLAGEALCRSYAGCYGVDAAALRYFNIFGPRQNANSAYAAVIAAFAKALLDGHAPTIFGDGEQSRDFTYVDNAVHANLLAAGSKTRVGGEVMNIACGQRITVNQLAEQMARALDRPDLQAKHLPTRAGDVMHSLANLDRARQLIGYEPVVAFQEGLDETVNWYAHAFKQC